MRYEDDTPELGDFVKPYPKNPPCNNFKDLKYNGKLIVFEGLDGSGKSTQTKLLKKYLEQNGVNVYLYNFIGSEFIKPYLLKMKWENCDPYTTSLIYAMGLSELINRKVIPKLKQGSVVILDRYINTIKTKATIRGVPISWTKSVFKYLPIPDCYIYLDTPEKTCLKRKVEKDKNFSYWECGVDVLGEDSIDRFNHSEYAFRKYFLEYQRKIGEIYKSIKKETLSININGNDDVEIVHKNIIKNLMKILGDKEC